MIRLMLFDLGETLIHDGAPFPHVLDALTTIAGFNADDGQRLALGIVSDYGSPQDWGHEDRIQAREAEFAAILRTAGIEAWFQPFERCVTISARAGVNKPDPRIFELAVHRSGLNAQLSECLFVTENVSHLLAARSLGLSILGFGNHIAGITSFDDWSNAPLLTSRVVSSTNDQNLNQALALALKDSQGVIDFTCLSRSTDNIQGQGTQQIQLTSPELGPLSGAYVKLPADVSILCKADGTIDEVQVRPPSEEDIKEATSYVQRLMHRGQISDHPEVLAKGATHAVETDAQGRRFIVRQRFST